MTMFETHPAIDEIADFDKDVIASHRRAAIARHLLRCGQCQNTMRFVQQISGAEADTTEVAPDALLQRIVNSRRAGRRTILPSVSAIDSEAGSLKRFGLSAQPTRWAIASALLIALTVVAIRSTELAAVESESTLQLSPTRPRSGDLLRVRYVPSIGTSFRTSQTLTLRGRLRTPVNDLYSHGVPVRALAQLQRQQDGAYTGSFVIPDSVVFIALAVEDTSANFVDTRNERLWDVLTFSGDTSPSFEALLQRSNDMMGRSWEEGYATTQRLVAAFPADVRSWIVLDFFERNLLSGPRLDSASAHTSAAVEKLILAAKSRSSLREDEMNSIHLRAWLKTWQRASSADSAELDFWWNRLLGEHPRSAEISQRMAVDLERLNPGKPGFLLDSLERAYPRLVAAEARIHQNFFLKAIYAAQTLKNDSLLKLWQGRMLKGVADSAVFEALTLVNQPAFRNAANESLRNALRNDNIRRTMVRGVTENSRSFSFNVAARRRQVLTALGNSLIATGAVRAGLDTLALAAASGWDLPLFKRAAIAYESAQDRSRAAQYAANIVVDPRTATSERDSIERIQLQHVSNTQWLALKSAAHDTMKSRTLAQSLNKSLSGNPRWMTESGDMQSLRETSSGGPTVVVFWSPTCGPALQSSKSIQLVADVLKRQGVKLTVLVTDEEYEIARRVAIERGLTVSLQRDVDNSVSTAFGNFGTPTLYVLDAVGRVRFRTTNPDAIPLYVAVLETHSTTDQQ